VPTFTEVIGKNLDRGKHSLYGVYVAVVTDNKDPDKLYRVKVRYPWQANGVEEASFWARITTFGAGKDRGMFCLPEVDDEVLVAFEGGEISHPVVIGSLWNSTQTVHLDNSKDGKNNERTWKSRSGSLLKFHDEKDKDTIEVSTPAGAKLLIDDTKGALNILLQDSKSENKLHLDTTNKKITMETTSGDMLIKAKGEIKIECKTLTVKSDQETTFDAGTNFKVKASSNVEIKASGTGELNSGGTMTIKGSMVNIN
jgi:uncharacterized protein involved in type VI secretion and phage assembly